MSRITSTRFRPHLETFEARIVPNGGYPGNPGGGQQPPPPQNDPQVAALMNAYRADLNTLSALTSQYGQAISRSTTAYTHHLYHKDASQKLLNEIVRLDTPGASDETKRRVTQMRQDLQYLNGLAAAADTNARRIYAESERVFIELGPLAASLVAKADELVRRTGRNPIQLGLGGIPQPPVYIPWDKVVSNAEANFRLGIDRPPGP